VRAVLLDFYGTLVRAVSWGPSYQEVLAGHGYVLDEGTRQQWVSDAFDGMEHLEHSTSREAYVAWERHRLAQVAAACGVGPDDAERLIDDLWLAGKSFELTAYSEVPAVLAELRRRGLVVAVCSNWDWDLDRALAATGLDELVDMAVTSARAGARKPHRRIFDVTLAAAGAEPGSALFVGDSWHADVEGPLAAGLAGAVHVHRVDDEREAPPLPPGGSIDRIESLTGLLDLVPASSG
jgi:putative hydrolase of the HAD superfamily